MVGAGILTAELIGKLSSETAKVLQTYLQTKSSKDIASFVEWGKAYNVSVKSIAEIVAVAYKSDVDIMRSSNDAIKTMIESLEKLYSSADMLYDRMRVFNMIDKLNNMIIETQTQANKRLNARQKFGFGAVITVVGTIALATGAIIVDAATNDGKATKEILKVAGKTIFKS